MLREWLAGAALAALAGGAASAATWDEINNAGSQSRDWLVYGGDLGQMRYVPSDQINTENVKDLKLKYIFQTGVVGSFENTPVVEGGVLYVTSPYNHLFAVDAATGRQLWHYEHKLATTVFCCGPNSRGVAVHGDLVIMPTLDAMLVAVNKKTGELVWETEVADPEMGYSLTQAPTVYQDKLLIGISGGEYGIRGFVAAFNVADGKEVWRWHTIPSPDDAAPDGIKGWEGAFMEKADGINSFNRDIKAEKDAIASGKFKDSWKRGGAGPWMTPAVDAERGWVFATTGNPSPDLDGSVRPGDNRWSDSLVAIDINTGKLVWAYQYIAHDVWDLDSASPPILAQVKGADGAMVDGVIHGGKTGWVYVHDRETGKLIRRSKEMIPHENLFALPTAEGTRMLPGANGGVEWSPGAFSPDNRHVYYVNLHQPMHYITHTAEWQQGKLWLGSAFVGIPGEQQWGNVTAVNVDTGEITWQSKTEQPMVGGGLVTKGNVFFAGEGNGMFRAYNALTGERLWEFQAGAGVNSAPMAFEVDGRPHVAVAAGGLFQLKYKYGNSLLVFALD
jgi:PQQ-dependent dehydrogenase (methanol/ethanol family)